MASLLLKFVQSFVDRHGYVRHYFRRPGYARVALPGLPGSPEFMAAYQAALGGAIAPKVEVGATRTIAGTMHWLITAYLSSPPFKTLAPETQRTRRNILENVREADGKCRQHCQVTRAPLGEPMWRIFMSARPPRPAASFAARSKR